MMPEGAFIGKKAVLLGVANKDTWYLFSNVDGKYQEVKIWTPGEGDQENAFEIMKRIGRIMLGDTT